AAGPRAVENEAEYLCAHHQGHDERRRFCTARENRFRAGTAVEHDRCELRTQFDDEGILGIDPLALLPRPAARRSTLEFAACTAGDEKRGGREVQHADGLIDEKFDE